MGTVDLARDRERGIARASAGRMNTPKSPTIPTGPQPQHAPKTPAPLDPDPKSHPIHREVPPQPIHEGTDPKHPVKRGGNAGAT